jgi:acyl-CoA synthetase (AMP-forming)/AMP-acid ligase II
MPVLLARAAHRLPNHEAIVDLSGPAVRRFTYADAVDRVVGLASHLRRSGIGAGDLVLVQAPNSAEAVFACWAAWHLGAVVNPVVDIYREHELRHIVAQARPDAVVTVAEHRGFAHAETFDTLLGEADVQVRSRVVLDGDGPAGWTPFDVAAGDGDAGLTPATVDPDDPALLLFTSGTTSLPKGAVHSSRTLVAETLQMANGWSFGWMDRMHLPLPIAHITGVLFALTVPMYRAGTVVLSRMVSMQQAVDEVVEHGVTTTASAPHAIPMLAEAYERAGIRSIPLKVLASGGTSVPKVLIEQGEAIGVRPCRIYGMTELPTVTMPCPGDTARQRLETDGRLGPGVECEAVDPDARTPLPSGVEGELRVRGPERMLGYLDADQTESQIDADGWFHTGDLGVVDGEGCVTVTGRIKDIINRGGEKFSCRDVEDLLVGHPSIAAAAVVAAPDRRYGEVPAAYVVAKEGVTVDTAVLGAWLHERGAARQKAPVHWRVVDALPMNASGKVKKFELVSALAGELAGGG